MRREPLGLTVGITTRNRPDSLRRCLASLIVLGDLVSEVIVIDDASDEPPVEALKALPAALASRLTFVRQPGGRGPIVGRNAIVRRAGTPFVLLLDDDTVLLDPAPLLEAIGILAHHPEVAAVACAQAEADGSPWPAGAQPSANAIQIKGGLEVHLNRHVAMFATLEGDFAGSYRSVSARGGAAVKW